jgi:methionyl-tRNA synthetase
MNQSDIETFSFMDPQGQAYGVDYTSLNLKGTPVKGMLCQLNPGATSIIHNHYEAEVFLFLSGQGLVHVDGRKLPIFKGMGIRVSPFNNHVIENVSSSEVLQFVSFYWEESQQSNKMINETVSDTTTLIFATPPTPNGDLHLGHVSGPYLAADIYRRYLLQRGDSAIYSTGRDDHQTYTVTKSLAKNENPLVVADLFADQIQNTLKSCNIPIDGFIEPNKNGPYGNFIKNIFQKLYKSGYIFEKNELATFSQDGKYLHEAYIRGQCPYCLVDSDGNACEACGLPNMCVDLLNAKEKLTGLAPVVRPCKRLYFRLSAFSKELSTYIKSTAMSAHALVVSQKLIDTGLPDICISHPGSWGIPVPVNGFEDHIIYVWFEMAAGYLWGAQQLAPETIKDETQRIQWFYNNEKSKVVHFYGFDNTFYHTLFFPAVYLALGEIRLPHAHIVNELLNLNGSKFSTSRNHLIWARDLVKNIPVDYMRWFLCETRPEGIRTNFELNNFIVGVNKLFNGLLLPWMNELLQLVNSHFQGKLPEAGSWTCEQSQLYDLTLSNSKKVINLYNIENFSPQSIVINLRMFAEKSFIQLQAEKTFTESSSLRNYLRTSIALSALNLKIFALLAKPIIPTISNHILEFINVSTDTNINDVTFLESGFILKEIYIPKLPSIDSDDLVACNHE